VQSFELLFSPPAALRVRKTCSKRALPLPQTYPEALAQSSAAAGPACRPSGAGARMAAPATAVTRSQRASEGARWRHLAEVTGETRGRRRPLPAREPRGRSQIGGTPFTPWWLTPPAARRARRHAPRAPCRDGEEFVWTWQG
jgi:hypothetical protein